MHLGRSACDRAAAEIRREARKRTNGDRRNEVSDQCGFWAERSAVANRQNDQVEAPKCVEAQLELEAGLEDAARGREVCEDENKVDGGNADVDRQSFIAPWNKGRELGKPGRENNVDECPEIGWY
jgi:predicted transcriptional regulator